MKLTAFLRVPPLRICLMTGAVLFAKKARINSVRPKKFQGITLFKKVTGRHSPACGQCITLFSIESHREKFFVSRAKAQRLCKILGIFCICTTYHTSMYFCGMKSINIRLFFDIYLAVRLGKLQVIYLTLSANAMFNA